jgi:hypothetical protein
VKCLSQRNTARQIDSQGRDCSPADWCGASQFGTMPCKMILPDLLPGIEQRANPTSYRINPRNIWSFIDITVVTGPSQIVRFAGTIVLQSNNVIRLKGEAIKGIWKSTVFTSGTRSISQQLSERAIHWPESDGPWIGASLASCQFANNARALPTRVRRPHLGGFFPQGSSYVRCR